MCVCGCVCVCFVEFMLLRLYQFVCEQVISLSLSLKSRWKSVSYVFVDTKQQLHFLQLESKVTS